MPWYLNTVKIKREYENVDLKLFSTRKIQVLSKSDDRNKTDSINVFFMVLSKADSKIRNCTCMYVLHVTNWLVHAKITKKSLDVCWLHGVCKTSRCSYKKIDFFQRGIFVQKCWEESKDLFKGQGRNICLKFIVSESDILPYLLQLSAIYQVYKKWRMYVHILKGNDYWLFINYRSSSQIIVIIWIQ